MTDQSSAPPPSSTADAPPPALQAPSDRSKRPQRIGDDDGRPSSPFPIYLSGVVQRGFGRGGKELGCPTANLPWQLLKGDDEEEKGKGSNSNTPSGSTSVTLATAPTGVYFGWARLISAREGGRGNEYQDRQQRDKDAVQDGSQKQEGAAADLTSSAQDDEKQQEQRADLKDEECVVLPMVMSLGWNPFYANKTKTAEVHIMHPFSTDFYGLQIRVIVLGYIRPEYNYTSLEALKEDIEMDKRVALQSLQPRSQRPIWHDFKEDPFFFQATSRLDSTTATAAL